MMYPPSALIGNQAPTVWSRMLLWHTAVRHPASNWQCKTWKTMCLLLGQKCKMWVVGNYSSDTPITIASKRLSINLLPRKVVRTTCILKAEDLGMYRVGIQPVISGDLPGYPLKPGFVSWDRSHVLFQDYVNLCGSLRFQTRCALTCIPSFGFSMVRQVYKFEPPSRIRRKIVGMTL